MLWFRLGRPTGTAAVTSGVSLFNWYVALLAISGIAMIAMALVKHGQSTTARSINFIFGAVFVGYAFYLAFLFDGGSYLIFFQAFIVPVLMAVNFFRNRTPRPKLTETQRAWREYQQSEQQR
ncbi:hypothetical protein [Nocardia pseudobrasiliensis]|uniref:Uncharacterized protein n=1 Tax=Nocardia pseudobrasiliensis TaxID=45979 RepID=A0A370IBT8_9NOCA|nr:hypothetical protein [Nocardia pseudobrasiliensis]RDI68186.1 hypothetical protein DFR76_102587 [Nocardia pseudobrasiliensis]